MDRHRIPNAERCRARREAAKAEKAGRPPTFQQQRIDWIDAGKCPLCHGGEDLVEGLLYGPRCRYLRSVRVPKTKVLPPSAPVPEPDRSVWDVPVDVPVDGLALAIREAEQDLEIA